MFAKTGPYTKMAIRKIVSFYNVAPISIQGETYSHMEEGLRYSEVKFAYDRYAIQDPYGSDLISNL